MEIARIMNKSRRSVQMLMKELINEGVIERVGSKKWEPGMLKAEGNKSYINKCDSLVSFYIILLTAYGVEKRTI